VVITDGGAMVTKTSTEFIVPNAPPLIATIDPVRVNEGEAATITAADKVSDANEDTDFDYEWRVTSGDNEQAPLLRGVDRTLAALTFTPAATFVAAEDRVATVILTLTVTDSAGASSEQDITVTVVKQNRGTITTQELGAPTRSEMILTAPTPNYAADPDGVATDTKTTYQWAICKASETNDCSADNATYTNINNATNATYTIPEVDNVEGNRFRVTITYTDGQGYPNEVVSAAFKVEPAVQINRLKIRAKVFLEGPLQ